MTEEIKEEIKEQNEEQVDLSAPDLNENFDKLYRRLNKVRINIMRDPKNRFSFYGGLLLLGKTYIDRRIPTAATDGYHISYNPDFMTSLSDKELAFVVLHEVSHVAFKHMYIWKSLFKEDHKRANFAADYVINFILSEMDPNKEVIARPEGVLYDAEFAGMHTKQIYDLLKGDARLEGIGGHDTHIIPLEDLPDDMRKEIDNAIKIAKAKGGNPFEREFGEIGFAKVPWDEELRKYAFNLIQGKDESSFRKLNRRFVGMDLFLPSPSSENIPCIVNAIDTSGSISTEELTNAMSEVAGIASAVDIERLDLIYWGSSVVGHEIYMSDIDGFLNSTKPKNGGGTDPDVIFDYIEEKGIEPTVVIVLTDGYFDLKRKTPPEYPVIWLITTDVREPDWGYTIRIN